MGAARQVGVRRILTVGMDEASNREAIAAAEQYEDVFASVGRHPNGATGFDGSAAEDLAELAGHERVVAIGETGLDYYRDRAPRDQQRAAFEAQIAIARRAGSAGGDPPARSRRRRRCPVRGLRHPGRRGRGRDRDPPLLLRAAGPGRRGRRARLVLLVRRQRHLSQRATPCARRLAWSPTSCSWSETDSPFLAPQSVRGKPNQPANVVEVAEGLAVERGLPYHELEQLVEANAARVFGW